MKTKGIVLFFAVIALLVVQSGTMLFYKPSQSVANLILIFLVTTVFFGDKNESLLVALVGGIFLDFTSGLPDGIFTASLLLMLMVLNIVINRFVPKDASKLILFTAVAGSTVLFTLSTVLFSLVSGWLGLKTILNYGFIFGTKLWFDLLYNLLLTYPIYGFYFLIKRHETKPI